RYAGGGGQVDADEEQEIHWRRRTSGRRRGTRDTLEEEDKRTQTKNRRYTGGGGQEDADEEQEIHWRRRTRGRRRGTRDTLEEEDKWTQTRNISW
ncbi:hypothetical protein LSAT2_026605, partial [Lamellibrachia satsuma]